MTTLYDRLADTVDLAEDLIGLLEDETNAIRAHDVATTTRLQPRKAAMTDAYTRDVKALSERAQDIADLGADWTDALVDVQARLDDAIAANMRALDIERGAAQRIFAIIRDSAQRANGRVDHYTAAGISTRSGTTAAVSINIDQRL